MVLVKSTGVVRLVFAFLLTTVFIVIIYNFSTISTHIPKSLEGDNGFRRPKHGGSLNGIDPLLQPEKGPKGITYGPGERNKTAATILSLVRNSELPGMLQSMRELEATWNHKFNYPWTFINDEPFTKEFKEKTRALTKAECFYGNRRPRSRFELG